MRVWNKIGENNIINQIIIFFFGTVKLVISSIQIMNTERIRTSKILNSNIDNYLMNHLIDTERDDRLIIYLVNNNICVNELMF